MTKKQKRIGIIAAILALLAFLWWYLTRSKVAVESLTVLPDEQVGTPGSSIPILPGPWPTSAPETQAQIDAGQALAAANPIAVEPEPDPFVDYQGILDERTKQIQAAIQAAAEEQAAIEKARVIY